jgi:hypothetical protein
MRSLRPSLAGLALAALACGTKSGGYGPSTDAGGPTDAGGMTDGTMSFGDGPSNDGPSFTMDAGPGKMVTGLAITPAQSTLVTMNGASGSQPYQVNAIYADGTSGPLGASPDWSCDQPAIGSINGSGVYTAVGSLGGTVTITAKYGTLTATATLLVKISYVQNGASVPTSVQTALQGATTPDPAVAWAYPYDQTVFPRGILESTLQWIGGNASDYYYIHVLAPTFELQTFTTAPNQWWDFNTTAWKQFLDTTSGPAEVRVTRWDGAQATQLVDQHWIVANGSMLGTIYYAAYYQNQGAELGKVLRIRPGAVTFDDFLDAGDTCTSCHTVSANGGTLVYNSGYWPPEVSVTYDLKGQSTLFSGLMNDQSDAGASEWALPGLSADGTTLLENFAPLRNTIGVETGAFNPATAAPIPSAGITKPLWMPVFSPDNLLLAYVDASTSDLRAYDWDPVHLVASNDRLIVASAANPSSPQIQYPTISPDHQWIVYQRGTGLGSLGIPGDVYLASVANPGTEVELDALDGTSYPFAAGSRDQHLNYQPTFAPVAAGGYFWLLFHSRRTYGNKLVSGAYEEPGVGTKQLWVSAFDQAPTAGADPSHPAFYLGGQSPIALNTRGFWALNPCLQDGLSCQTGTDCCSGFCQGTPDAGPEGGAPAGDGGLVCGQSSGCSADGNKCSTTADCCNALSGTTCINSVCSVPPPRDGGAM